jgi:tetratricopeptide (TPR) repeat protein
MPSDSRKQLHELTQSQPWFTNRIELPNSPSGMLGQSEATLYYHLAKTVFRGVGTIVDAGSFLGKSAYYLAHGLGANPNYAPERDRIHCFDNFIVNGDDTVEFIRAVLNRTVAVGDSTREIFDSNVAPVADMLDIHHGDFHTIPWPHQPIEILVVDIAKNEELGGRVIGSFFQDLIPGESLVIHQDYHHPWLPHIHVTMEYLADYFELVIPRVDDSAVFLCRKAIPPDVLRRAAEYHFAEAEKVALMNAAISRLPSEHRYYVALAGIVLRSEMVDPATIREELDQLERQFQENGRNYSLNPYFGGVRNHIDVREGWHANGEGRFERGLELSGQILARERNSYNLTMRGCALFGLKRFKQAEEQLREALQLRPTAAWAYLELSRLLMSQNRLAEGEAVLLRGFPDYASEGLSSIQYLDYLSDIWTKEDPLTDKTTVMATLHRNLPGDPEVWVLDARRLVMAGDFTSARSSLEVATRLGLSETRLQKIREELKLEA